MRETIVYCFQRLVLAIGLAYYPQNAYRLSPPPCHVLKSDEERRVFKRSKKEIYMSVLGIDNRKSIFYDASNKSHCTAHIYDNSCLRTLSRQSFAYRADDCLEHMKGTK